MGHRKIDGDVTWLTYIVVIDLEGMWPNKIQLIMSVNLVQVLNSKLFIVSIFFACLSPTLPISFTLMLSVPSESRLITPYRLIA